MTSTVKVDNVQKVSDASNIIKKCGTTITLGASGDSIALASGASQTGFGRTGTVDWVTTPKTATFTAVNGEGYFCNTAGGAFEVDLPAGTAGAIVSIQDYNNTFDTHAITVDPNGSEKINGGVAGGTIELTTEGEGVTLVYVDSTVGWRSIHQSTFADTGSNAVYVAASGGNTTLTCGNFKTHIFTGPGTFTVSCAGNACGSNTVDYFVVAGGGGSSSSSDAGAAGAGAGGFRLSNSAGCLPAPTMSPLANPTGLPVTATGYPVTVGAGGSNLPPGTPGARNPGSNSVFTGSSTITSAGGGASGRTGVGLSGGSGGGGSQGPGPTSGYAGGAGNTPPVSPPQGNNGGAGYDGISVSNNGGGGGAAGAVGGNAANLNGGDGGAGSYISNSFFGPTAPSYGTAGPVSSTRYFAGGGGGNTDGPGSGGDGGAGGGGIANHPSVPSCNTNGTVNTGGGTGAGGPSGGGSGIVAIRYRFQ